MEKVNKAGLVSKDEKGLKRFWDAIKSSKEGQIEISG
jgi:hypothetical protein